jgi:outer membrane protein OmpA-like peptidoglycan-associated protein
MSGDEARRIIPARRARFLAAALVGITGCPARQPEAPASGDIVIPPLSADAAAPLLAARDDDAGRAARADQDNDGIADEDDACPDRPGPASADPRRNGCPQVIVSVCLSIIMPPKVTFPSGGAGIGGVNLPTIDAVEKTLKGNPQITLIEIEGHTDTTENASLGQARADAVKRELVRRGIDAGRLTTTNAAATKPLDTNATAEGRAKNRRIEFRVLTGP